MAVRPVSGAQRISRAQDPWEIVAQLLTRVEALESRPRQATAVSTVINLGAIQLIAVKPGDGTVVLFATTGTSTPVPIATLDL